MKKDCGSWVGNLVQVSERRICAAEVIWADGVISHIGEMGPENRNLRYLIPGFLDAHIHIESSLLIPTEFARVAVRHGTVGCICDPHEIANVLGLAGIRFMLDNARLTPFRFLFGAPPCVPATGFETAGAELGAREIEMLFRERGIGFLAEVMNVPGVLAAETSILGKIDLARGRGWPVDGHAPGLSGAGLRRYAAAGITTDHECTTLDEALEKLQNGIHVLIREGSAARNFNTLHSLIGSHPDRVMLCSDDRHPDDLVSGHIDRLAARAVAFGHDVFDVLRCACLNPARHYHLPVGLLREGDLMDGVEVTDLSDFATQRTWLHGILAYDHGATLLPAVPVKPINRFAPHLISPDDLTVLAEGGRIRVIDVQDGDLHTGESLADAKKAGNRIVPDPSRDILLLCVINRYFHAPPAIAFVRGFGLRAGAIASSVAHDSHNVIAVGVDAAAVCAAVNAVMHEHGGLAVAGPEGLDVLPLPIAGLMSLADGDSVAARYAELNRCAQQMGSPLTSPLMTLSFLALLVMPELKLSDRGLFDSRKFQFTSLTV